jgi:hypothetical protein
MTEDKEEIPCCGNCPISTKRDQCPIWIAREPPYDKEFGWNWWIENGNTITKFTGCLSHPGAKAYLNKDVIKTLDAHLHEKMAEHESRIATQATEAENKRVLEILDKFYDNIKVAHRHDTSNYSEGLLDGIDLSITEIKNKSLRLAQPEPKERDPE